MMKMALIQKNLLPLMKWKWQQHLIINDKDFYKTIYVDNGGIYLIVKF